MKIFTSDGIKFLDCDTTITYNQNGTSTAEFTIPTEHEYCRYLMPETRLEIKGQYYNLKSLADYQSDAYTAELDLDDLKARKQFLFEKKEVPLDVITKEISDRTGWTFINNTGIRNKRTFSMQDVNDYEILVECGSVYEVHYLFDNVNKICTIINIQDIKPSGDIITDQLNLTVPDYKSDTYNLCTRLYCYGGTDALGNTITFADINDGKDYVEDFSYCGKVIEQVWRDERYKDKQSLLIDGKKRLEAMAKPNESYELPLVQLGKKYKMHDIVTLLDRKRKRKVEHRIVKIVEHTNKDEDTVITLAALPPSLEDVVKNMNNDIEVIQDINKGAESDLKKVEAAMYYYTNTAEFAISTIQRQFASFEFKVSADANLLLHASLAIEGNGTVEASIYIDDTLMKFKPKLKVDTNGLCSFTYPTIQLDKQSHYLELRLTTDADNTMKIAPEQGHVVLYGQKLVGGLSDSRPHAEITEYVYYDQLRDMPLKDIDDNAVASVQYFINSVATEYITDYMMQEISMDMIKQAAQVELKHLGYIVQLSLTDFIKTDNYTLDGHIRYQSEDVEICGETIVEDQDYKVSLLPLPDSDVYYYVGAGEIRYE